MTIVARHAIDIDAPALDTPADQFFACMYAGQTGMLELRTVPLDPTSEFERKIAWRFRDFVPVVEGRFDSGRVAQFLKRTAERRMAAYYGVALRTQEAAKDRKGDRVHCQTLTALFVDCDFKHLGEVESRRRLADFPIPPSIIVNSGGGLHPYWLLRRPIDLQHDYAGAQSILRRLALGVAEIVDQSVSEPARILRIPGSVNFKYDPPRAVTLEYGV